MAENSLRLSGQQQLVKIQLTYLDLTDRDVLTCVMKSLSYRMIDSRMNISYETVRTYMKHIYEKRHIVSMTEAVAKATGRAGVVGQEVL